MTDAELVKALLCNEAPDEPGNMGGCVNEKCKYRDVDGACDLVSMCADAADRIEQLVADLARVTAERDVAIIDLKRTSYCHNCKHIYNKRDKEPCAKCRRIHKKANQSTIATVGSGVG